MALILKCIRNFIYIAAFTCCMPLKAEILTFCNVHEGQFKYLDANPKMDYEDFSKDGMSSLEIVLLYRNDAGKTSYNIAYSIDGARTKIIKHPTYLLSHNPTNGTYLIFVDASAESFVETYLFRLDGKNTSGKLRVGEVVWTQSRNGGTPKVSMFRSPCFFEN